MTRARLALLTLLSGGLFAAWLAFGPCLYCSGAPCYDTLACTPGCVCIGGTCTSVR